MFLAYLLVITTRHKLEVCCRYLGVSSSFIIGDKKLQFSLIIKVCCKIFISRTFLHGTTIGLNENSISQNSLLCWREREIYVNKILLHFVRFNSSELGASLNISQQKTADKNIGFRSSSIEPGTFQFKSLFFSCSGTIRST